MGWKWCTWWVAREEEPPQIREKTLERLVPLTRGGREGRDSSRLLLEPMLERERERDDDDDDDDNGKWKMENTNTHTQPNSLWVGAFALLSNFNCFRIEDKTFETARLVSYISLFLNFCFVFCFFVLFLMVFKFY